MDPINPGTDMLLSLYGALGTVLTALLSWLSVRIAAWIKTKTQNELVGGTLGRLSDSVFTAVKLVNQTLKKEIEASKLPGSPGGTAITKDEATRLKSAAMAVLLAEYGGLAGLTKVLGVLGLTSEAAVTSWVGSKIEAAVHDVKAENPQTPVR
jgi:hypothetical protein